jgi:hypothetical protein
MPLNATRTSGNAKITFSSDGEPAMAAESVNTSGWNSSARPSATITSCSMRSASTSRAARSKRLGPGPRMAVSAT